MGNGISKFSVKLVVWGGASCLTLGSFAGMGAWTSAWFESGRNVREQSSGSVAQRTVSRRKQPSSDGLSLASGAAPSDSQQARVRGQLAKLAMSFEPNYGQAAEEVKFVARSSGYAVFITAEETVVQLSGDRGGKAGATRDGVRANPNVPPAQNSAVLRLQLVGANPIALLRGKEELPGRSSYFIGNQPEKWRRDIPNYRKVVSQGVYRGIDMAYYGTQRQLEYDFVVAPGADPRIIQIAFRGARKLRVNRQGDLIADIPGGEVRLQRPIAYQETSGAPEDVAANYVLAGQKVAFKLGKYDRRRALIIDPILSYSTYLGGSNIDGANAIAVAPDGTAFVAGGTFSIDFPTVHALQPNIGGPNDLPKDAFVAKLSADGSTLLYATYLGGENQDEANGVAVDAFGDAYVVGTTLSPHFPVTPADVLNPDCGSDGKCGATFNSNGLIVSNAFVTKLNPEGSGLIYSTFFGEYENVRGQAIAVDANQNAYITGSTGANLPVTSVPPPPVPPRPFPITAGAFQTVFGGGTDDVFVAKINATGTSVEYSSYLGGTDEEIGYGIAVDRSANAYLTGLTYSGNFPAVNALQATNGGAGDAFVSKVNTNAIGAASLPYSTFFGGSNLDQGNGIAVDNNGIAYISGFVGSLPVAPTASFCGNTAAAGTFCSGDADAFALKIDATKTGAASLIYFTNFGGSGADSATGVAVDPLGNAYIAGSTVSNDFPTTTAVFQPKYGGGNADAFVTKLDPTGATLLYSTFLGGTNTDTANGIAVDTTGGAYVAGQTCSLDFPLANPVQGTPGGNCDAFVSKVSILNGIQLNPAGLVFPPQSLGTSSQPQTVTLTNGDSPLNISKIAICSASATCANPGDFADTTTCGPALLPGAQCAMTVIFTPTGAGIRKASIVVTDDAPGSPQVIDLDGQSSTLTLSASSLAFGNQAIGVASNALAITATNRGTTAVTFSSITASGDFSEKDDCIKAALQPTTNCVINVTYTPSTVGSSIGALTLTDNAPGSPQIVLLTGTGVGSGGGTTGTGGSADFTLSSDTTGTSISAGHEASFTVTLDATAGFSQTVTLTCSGMPQASTCVIAPQVVSPTASTPASAIVTISTDARTFGIPLGWEKFWPPQIPIWIWTACFTVLLCVVFSLALRRRPAMAATFCLITAVIGIGAGCNGGSANGTSTGTAAGAYQVIITGTAGNVSHSVVYNLEVN